MRSRTRPCDPKGCIKLRPRLGVSPPSSLPFCAPCAAGASLLHVASIAGMRRRTGPMPAGCPASTAGMAPEGGWAGGALAGATGKLVNVKQDGHRGTQREAATCLL